MASNLCAESEDENASCYEADLTDPISANDCQNESQNSYSGPVDQEDQGDFLFMACADWENVKEDSDQEDSHKSNDLKDKRLAKL